MQRIKVRDYYDIWKMLGKDGPRDFDATLIGDMVRQKCAINDIEYDPSKIFDAGRLDGLREHWGKELGRLVAGELPEPDKVFSYIRNLLRFLPVK